MIKEVSSALSDPKLVQSFSGVRTVFGLGPDILPEHQALATAYGYCYVKTLLSKNHSKIILGRDPRPTGYAITRSLAKGFLAGAKEKGIDLELFDLGIITTPLAQTAVRALQADGGVMVTASHNPLDNNGFKFLTGFGWAIPHSAPAGALLSAKSMTNVIQYVKNLNKDIPNVSDIDILSALDHPDREVLRVKAERAYLDAVGDDWGIAPHCLKPLTLGPVLLDPNGGAGCGIDARVLEHFGVRVIEVNAELGYPEHGIDTDGIDPASGRHMLLRVAKAAARNRAHFGVAFDYDADRGNLVLPGHDESAIIPPQRVATFNIALALARRRLYGDKGKPLAIVASDATSLASHRVAKAFGAEIFQVETGEINVVTRIAELRNEGYDVPVGVEGANGGTIFESGTCRDGLHLALAAAQAESSPEIACEWIKVVNRINGCPFNPEQRLSLADLVNSIPMNPNVMLKLSSPPIPPSEIKSNLERLFIDSYWPALKSRFATFRFENFEETRMVDSRSGDESGAWRLMLESPKGSAFVFIRGSRTESGVWRMIVDAENPEDFQVVFSIAKDLFSESIAAK